MTALSPYEHPSDEAVIARKFADAFGTTIESCKEWIQRAGPTNIRVLRDDAKASAVLVRIPMGTFLGCQSVPMLGVAGVAVSPQDRGSGCAKRLMQGFVRDAAEEGWPLSGLYASTHTLYRSVGYEHAGHNFMNEVQMHHIDVAEKSPEVVPLTDAHMPSVHACYERFARSFDGMCDRGPYLWRRIKTLRERTFEGYGVRASDGSLDGYVFAHQSSALADTPTLSLSDFVFLNPHAGRRLWGFLRNFGTMMERVTFYGGPMHPALSLLQQQRYSVKLKDSWMFRVLNLQKAIEGRGYNPCVNAHASINVTDELVPANHGTFTIRASGGTARVERGGDGAIRLGPRALASLITGFASPHHLKLMGLIDAPDAALTPLSAIFQHGAPWTNDHY